MTPVDAFMEAKKRKRENPAMEASELDDLARIAAHNSNQFWVSWVRYVGTHLELMAGKLLESSDVSAMAIWCAEVDDSKFSHSVFKHRVIELGVVEEFVSELNFASKNSSYSLEDFYSDLPLEARVGVNV